jgi:hypothetical protein
MSKILVIGDSFAKFDPVHLHWVDIWSQQYGLDVEHFAHPGNNAVNIVSEFEIKYKEPYDFKFAVFQVPDFFRSEVASLVTTDSVHPFDRTVFQNDFLKNKELLEQTINSNTEAYMDLLPEYASKFRLEHVQSFYWLMHYDQTAIKNFIREKSPRDVSIVEHARRFYESASPRWVFRSNLTALKYFNTLMQLNDIPCCFVLNPGLDELEVNAITSAINLPFWHMAVRSENIGDNHVSLTHAQECATLFEQYNNDRKLFLVRP